MERKILFRGKRADNGEWVYGCYLKEKACDGVLHIIVDEDGGYYPINPKTLCQYVGLTDKNGRKIFEGDFLVYPCFLNRIIGYIRWLEHSAQFRLYNLCDVYDNTNGSFIELISGYIEKSEVIGNIYDNSVWLDRTTPRKWKALLKGE